MEGDRRECESEPKDSSSHSNEAYISHAENPNVEPMTSSMSVLALVSCRSGEDLHGVIASTQQQSTENVDDDVRDCACLRDTRRTPSEESRNTSPIARSGGGADDRKCAIHQQHECACTCPDYNAPLPAMEATLPFPKSCKMERSGQERVDTRENWTLLLFTLERAR